MQTPLLKDITPSDDLKEYVRKYQVFRFLFDTSASPPVKFHAPRPEHSITFYIKDAQKFSYLNSPLISTYPICVINGMYTIPVQRYGGNDFWAIKVVLQPSTLYHLINIPLPEITNNYINAEDVWRNKIRLVCEQLSGLDDLCEMLSVIETFLRQVIGNKTKEKDPIDKVSNLLINMESGASLHWLAGQSCLSMRQFIRKFEIRTGISAKTFQRIIRFDKAFRMKNIHPDLDWLSIALRCDYHDYQHLAKDFNEFTQLTPPAFYKLEKTSPERSFGLVEA
ncbi:MAG: AraC family transcriptional regulator [Sphingobacteriales bacterium]|nr:MAG: AraC family transcriptional regulator [Sphingobacteriales bacterium]